MNNVPQILIVEDDFIEADRIKDAVNNFYENKCSIIGPFTNFNDSLEAIKNYPPTVAILDINLGTDRFAGINIARTLLQFHPIPFIFVTGMLDDDILEEVDTIDSCDFLEKPWDYKGLQRALKKAIKGISRQKGHFNSFLPDYQDQLILKLGKGKFKTIPIPRIVLIQSEEHYNKYYINSERHPIMVKSNLAETYLKNFKSYNNFYQLGKSVILNRDYIYLIEANHVFIKTSKETPLPIKIPRGQKPMLIEWFQS